MMSIDIASSTCLAKLPEDTASGHASGYPAPAGVDKDFVIGAANILQALLCLSNLMSAEADDPAKVRVYAYLDEQRLQALGKLICPMLWNAA